MAQAMLSGCVVAMTALQTHHGQCSLPAYMCKLTGPRTDILDPLVLTLPKPRAPYGQVPAQSLADVLKHTSDADLQIRALRAFIVARQMLTPVSRMKTVENLVEQWRSGGRGYNVSLTSTLREYD